MKIPGLEPWPWPVAVLGDDVIVLRAWDHEDLDAVAEASSDPAIPRITTVPHVYSRAEGLAWVQRQHGRSQEGGLVFAIADRATNAALGAVSVWWRPNRIGWLGYWVLPSQRGRGIASRGVRALVPYAFESLGLARVEIGVEPRNAASTRVAEACGFTREGTLRSYEDTTDGDRVDLVLFSLLPGELRA
jgi:ribosomal-protein-alanine N-acetyltransferase